MTSEAFNDLSKNIESEKNNIDKSLSELLSSLDNLSVEKFNKIYSEGMDFFSKFERFITSCSSEYGSLSKIQVEDILVSIENVLKYSIVYIQTMRKIASKLNIDINLQDNFLYTSQIIYKSYKKHNAKKIKEDFKSNFIPVKGFIAKEKFKLTTPTLDITSLIIGVVLLLITIVIAFLLTINTGMQYWITRIFGSLGTALVITAFSKHSIQAKINIPSYAITATGAIAVFFILYLANPANEPKYSAKNNSTNIVNNGNNNIVILQERSDKDFYKQFQIEKELNTKLLISLSNNQSSDYLLKLAYNPKYLNTNFINSFNIYKNIKNKKIISYLIELKTLLNDINNKIKKLHSANLDMLSGNLRSMNQAIFDFVNVSNKAKRILELYQLIEKTHNKSLERNI